MCLNRMLHQCLYGDVVLNHFNADYFGKGLMGQYTVNWMQNYFMLHYEVMPTIGQLHLSDNYTRDELFKMNRDELETRSEWCHGNFSCAREMKRTTWVLDRKVLRVLGLWHVVTWGYGWER